MHNTAHKPTPLNTATHMSWQKSPPCLCNYPDPQLGSWRFGCLKQSDLFPFYAKPTPTQCAKPVSKLGPLLLSSTFLIPGLSRCLRTRASSRRCAVWKQAAIWKREGSSGWHSGRSGAELAWVWKIILHKTKPLCLWNNRCVRQPNLEAYCTVKMDMEDVRKEQT